jgi:hypothetical protein
MSAGRLTVARTARDVFTLASADYLHATDTSPASITAAGSGAERAALGSDLLASALPEASMAAGRIGATARQLLARTQHDELPAPLLLQARTDVDTALRLLANIPV